MATEVAHEPASQRQALNVNTGSEKISGILNREIPEEPQEEEAKAPQESESQAPEPPVEEDKEVPAKEEAKEEDAKEEEPESEVTSEVELEPAQVAQLLGLDEGDISVDDEGAIQLHAKIDGKPATVSLKDLRHNYELAQTHEERLRQLGRERKSFEDQSKAYLESLVNQHQSFTQAVKALEEEYAQDFQSVDWTTLRSEDPTEYNAKRLDYEDRRKRIEEYKAKAQNQAQELQRQHSENVQRSQAEGAQRLNEVFEGDLYRNAPKWDENERKRLGEWIMEQGFSAQDIASVSVWHVFKWARDSMLREQELKKAKESVKKVVKMPKVSKPGPKQPPDKAKKARVTELKDKQRKSGGGLRETAELIRGLTSER